MNTMHILDEIMSIDNIQELNYLRNYINQRIEELEEDTTRTCNICGIELKSGFCIHDGDEYFCNTECLHKRYTEEEYNEMYDEDEAYWTEWDA